MPSGKPAPALTSDQRERAFVVRNGLANLRHWMTGFEMGTEETIPSADFARLAILFLDELIHGQSSPSDLETTG